MHFGQNVKEWLMSLGMSNDLTSVFRDLTDFVLLLITITIVYQLAKLFILKVLRKITQRSSAKWDDAMYKNKVFHKIALLIPPVLFDIFAPYTLGEFPEFLKWSMMINQVILIFSVIALANKFVDSLYEIYQNFEISRSKPLKGYMQVIKIIFYIIGALIVISLLFNKSPLYLLTGLGAFSAVLLLIFKDPILGLVAGIQISANDMVRQGDWIVLPKSGADGTVTEISLTTVKVQNWDKSITMIPAYSLVSDSFINWRGMEEAGVRRIKRSINIDMNSVKFCTPEMLERFRNIKLISEYIDQKQTELTQYNSENEIDNSILVNGRRQTNLGVFRAYVAEYVKSNPYLEPNVTMLVRQLQPGESGLPLEVYVFSKIQDWQPYEDIQSDIFDHILAAIPEFELSVFQNPTGGDFRRL